MYIEKYYPMFPRNQSCHFWYNEKNYENNNKVLFINKCCEGSKSNINTQILPINYCINKFT